MVEITIRLSEAQAEQLRQRAMARGQSLEAYLTQLAVQAAPETLPLQEPSLLEGLEVRFERQPSGYVRVKLYRNGVEVPPETLPFIGHFCSGTGDLAARHDEYFAEAILTSSPPEP